MEETETISSENRAALIVWCVCVAVLMAPSLLAWAVRAIAYAAACTPGPGACNGMTLGGGLRDTLALAWMVSTNTLFLVTVSLVATLAAFCDRKPLVGTFTFLLLPLLSPALPTLLVYVSVYEGCPVNTDGIGDCTLWGAHMGPSFHTAAAMQDMIVGLTPYVVALTVMLGIVGWFFAHPHKRKPKPHAGTTMPMRKFGEPPFDGE